MTKNPPPGRTVKEQLEAWRDAKPEAERSSALRIAGLDKLYARLCEKGELDDNVQRGLSSPRIHEKLTVVGIDVERTWVDMAKKAVDPTHDWLPEAKTRHDIVELLRPYYLKLTGAALAKYFFDGTRVESFFREQNIRYPGWRPLVKLVRFLTDDRRHGTKMLEWGEHPMTYRGALQDVFGEDTELLPDVTGDEAFYIWFVDLFPRERVDFVARKLNEALGQKAFSAHLLINWHENKAYPSQAKFEVFLRAARIAFPQWLDLSEEEEQETPERGDAPVDSSAITEGSPDAPPESVEPTPEELPKNGTGLMAIELVEVPPDGPTTSERGFAEILHEVSVRLTPGPDENTARARVAQAQSELHAAQDELHGWTLARAERLRALGQELDAAEQRLQERAQELAQRQHALSQAESTLSEEDRLVSGRESVGERVAGVRFVLTADSFQPVGTFTLREVDDTNALLESTASHVQELARRLALINSMDAATREAVLKRLRPAYTALAVQARTLEVSVDELPTVFEDQALAAEAWGDRNLGTSDEGE